MSRASTSDSTSSAATAGRFLRIGEVMKLTSKRRTGLYKSIKDGEFPPQIKDGKSSVWLSTEVELWMAARAASRGSSWQPPASPTPLS
jgi:prophage regulatory protein